MLNEIEQFKGAMLAHGLTPPEVIEPGKLHRFSTNGKGAMTRAGASCSPMDARRCLR